MAKRFWAAATMALAATAVCAAEPTDMDGAKTKNGKIAVDYVNMRFNQGKMAEADKLYTSPAMVEHGWLGMSGQAARGGAAPGAGAPPPAAPRAARSGAPQGAETRSSMDIKKVLVQGDLVFVQALGHQGPGNGDLIWILYRIKDGKVVEHWDTHNAIPDNQVGKQF